MVSMAKASIQDFAKVRWPRLWEFSLKTVKQKVYDQSQDANSAGNLELVGIADFWCVLITSAKEFLGLWRDFWKSSKTDAQFMPSYPTLLKVMHGLKNPKSGVEPAATLRL